MKTVDDDPKRLSFEGHNSGHFKYFVHTATGRARYSIIAYLRKLNKEGFINKDVLNRAEKLYSQLKARSATKRKGITSRLREDKK